jgi:hypothetical protein
VSHTLITDFFGGRTEATGGGRPQSPPGTQDFWVASSSGPGARALTWDPADGSWTVVVMNADGRPGIDVSADLGARLPALGWIAVGLVLAGAVLLVGGVILIAGSIRRRRAGRATTDAKAGPEVTAGAPATSEPRTPAPDRESQERSHAER